MFYLGLHDLKEHKYNEEAILSVKRVSSYILYCNLQQDFYRLVKGLILITRPGKTSSGS